MHKRPLKNAASLSLNKDVQSGSWNPILHSSKSPSKPCDHFVVYLYQSVEKLNRTDTSHMLIPFMFPGQKSSQHFFFEEIYININTSPPTMMPREYSPSICCQTGSTAFLLPGGVRNTGQRWAALVETKANPLPPPDPCTNPHTHPPTDRDHWRQRRALLPIGSWVIDYQ